MHVLTWPRDCLLGRIPQCELLSNTGSGANLFKCSAVVLCCISEPNHYATCFCVDLGHELDLLSLFVVVVLVDADGIYPYDAVYKAVPKMEQRSEKTWPDGQLVLAYVDDML